VLPLQTIVVPGTWYCYCQSKTMEYEHGTSVGPKTYVWHKGPGTKTPTFSHVKRATVVGSCALDLMTDSAIFLQTRPILHTLSICQSRVLPIWS